MSYDNDGKHHVCSAVDGSLHCRACRAGAPPNPDQWPAFTPIPAMTYARRMAEALHRAVGMRDHWGNLFDGDSDAIEAAILEAMVYERERIALQLEDKFGAGGDGIAAYIRALPPAPEKPTP